VTGTKTQESILHQVKSEYWSSGETDFAGRADRLQPGEAARLARTIEAEIIPRLMLAHELRSVSSASATEESPPTEGDDAEDEPEGVPDRVARLCALLVGGEVSRADTFVRELVATGESTEVVFIDVLMRTAHHLGELWHQDRASFTEVTVALGKLQRMVWDLSSGSSASVERPHGPRALVVTTPGDDHAFGVQVISELLRAKGWAVRSIPGGTRQEILSALSKERFLALVVSTCNDALLESTRLLIASARSSSLNQALFTVVGGASHGGGDVSCGADCVADSIQRALKALERTAEEAVAARS